MEQVIVEYINAIEFGDVQACRNMALIPLFAPVNNIPRYLTLKEALRKGMLTITEVSDSGSVPELLAKNSADIPVLLLDGEELAGAKQNRVLNTTILLREKSETIIPVSCTEHGRWQYRTEEFRDSEVIMARKVRANKARTVTDSLRSEMMFRSDQGQVWDDIARMSRCAGVESQTGAMRDVYESKGAGLDEYTHAFPLRDGQKGLLVLIGGSVAGCDVVSLVSAYADLHEKLVKSYAMDAFIEAGEATKAEDHLKAGRTFFEAVLSCAEERYRSVGYGTDYRFEGCRAVGSALVTYGKVIHMAFFRTFQTGRSPSGMSGSGQRRANRTARRQQ